MKTPAAATPGVLEQTGAAERLPVRDPRCGDAADPVELMRSQGFRILRCRRCGLAWSDPQISDEALGRLVYTGAHVAQQWKQPRRKSWPRRAFRAARSLLGPVGHVEKRWAFVRRWLPADQPLRVLEVGCWTGELLAMAAAQAPRWQVQGVDSSPFAVQQAQAAGLRVTLTSLEDAPFAPDSFEGLIAWNVLEHTHDPLAFLQAARRVLTPGGRCVLHLPNFGGVPARLAGPRWTSLMPEQHRWHFTCRALADLLEASGGRVLYLCSSPLNLGKETRAVVAWP